MKGRLLEGYCHQVKICLEIAMKCVQHELRNRLAMPYIIDTLNGTEAFFQEIALPHSKLLYIHPLELYFLPFTSSMSEPRKKNMISSSSCSLQLHNKGDDRVAFMLVANKHKRYLMKKPLCGVVPPRCAYTLTLTIMPNKQQHPQRSSDNDDFFMLYSVMLGGYDLLDANKDNVTTEYNNFFTTKEMASGDEVQKVKLNVICDQPAAKSAATSSSEFPCAGVIRQLTRPTVEVIFVLWLVF
jgi:coatomer subunit beta'